MRDNRDAGTRCALGGVGSPRTHKCRLCAKRHTLSASLPSSGASDHPKKFTHPWFFSTNVTYGWETYFGHQLFERRIRHRSRGSAQKTLGHTDALRASLPGNRDCTLGNRLYLHQAQPRRQRIRHRSRGTEQKTPRQSVALPAALPMNCGRTLGNHLPLPMGISADATDTWATYFIFWLSSGLRPEPALW